MESAAVPAYQKTVVTAGLLVLSVLFTAAYLAVPAGLRTVVSAVAAFVPVVAIAVGLRVNQLAERLPWLLVMAGSAVLGCSHVVTVVQVVLGGAARPDEALLTIFNTVGYLTMLAASTLVVLRHAPNDSGGVLDAAVMGIATAAPAWEFVLLPRLREADISPAGQLVVLLQTLVLLGILGSLLRITRTTGRSQAALNYLFAALASAIVSLVLTVLIGVDPTSGQQPVPAGICGVLGYLCLAAGGTHPSVLTLMRPIGQRRDELSLTRLAYLGLFLALIPVIGGVTQLFGGTVDGLLLSLGPLLMLPLVITRIGLLMAQRSRDQRSLAHQANHDELTGLANRRRLFNLVEEAMSRYDSGGLAAVSVLYCDLDGFKPINDRLGHEAGDHVLRVVGERLTGWLRDGDAVGRIGGDEFLALCPGAGPGAAEALRLRLEEVLAAPLAWRGQQLRVGVTVGLAVAHHGVADLLSADALVARADHDMYVRKRARALAATLPAERGPTVPAERVPTVPAHGSVAPAQPPVHSGV